MLSLLPSIKLWQHLIFYFKFLKKPKSCCSSHPYAPSITASHLRWRDWFLTAELFVVSTYCVVQKKWNMKKWINVIIIQENVVETRCFNQVDFTWIKEPTRQSYHNCLEVEVHNHSLIHWENDTVKTVHCSKRTGLNIHRFWLENKLRECRIVHIGTLGSSRPGSSISLFCFFWLT